MYKYAPFGSKCASKLCKSGNRQFKNAFYDKYTSESDDRLWKKIIDHQNR